MADSFLQLPTSDRAEILTAGAATLGRTAVALEKDVWICWALQKLFEMPGRQPMAFKGGTSLSKVFDAINRFSEDVDITIDYRGFVPDANPFDPALSKTKKKQLSEEIKEKLSAHTHNVIRPYFQNLLKEEFGYGEEVTLDEDGEALKIPYETAVEEHTGYIGQATVLVEFGGRNTTDPKHEVQVTPYVQACVNELAFPRAIVAVLDAKRTFWEKATLAHVACLTGKVTGNGDKAARHWHDLAVLSNHDIGKQAVADRGLLEDVVKHKQVFFPADYDDCATGGLRLIPGDPLLKNLRNDYEAMLAERMIYGHPLSFDEINKRLTELETAINAAADAKSA